MICFVLIGHDLYHDTQAIVQVFYPNLHYYQVDKISEQGITIVSTVENDICRAELYEDAQKKASAEVKIQYSQIQINGKSLDDNKRDLKRFLKTSIYNMLTEYTGMEISWGILTGIRPAKNVNEYYSKGADEEEIRRILTDFYFVQPDKAELAIKVAAAERKILQGNNGTTAGIYVGIPFCPTRCLYCSFTSFSLKQYGNKVDEYLKALIKEIRYIAEYAKRYTLESVYVGGGTPTSLNEGQLEQLLEAIAKYFDISSLKEYTVEAGRPDTITKEKLRLLKQYNVGRISINPQTMNQKTLDLIGRKHTVEEINKIFYVARSLGHENINMDLILGLPGEDLADVENTFKNIQTLAPDNLTVHTLAVKRASRLKETLEGYTFINKNTMETMLKLASSYATGMNMKPYYMYRQKNMVGNFENVGYCIDGKESIYNIQIMEEKQTILSAGAGSTTKIVYPDGRIERIFNVKSLEDYIGRIDEMLQRKEKGLPEL